MQFKIYNEIMQIIDRRRRKAEMQVDKNRIQAFQNKAFKKAYEAYVTDVIKKTQDFTFVKPFITYLKDPELLSLASTLKAKYFCENCKDTGVNPITGKFCECYHDLLNLILVRESGFKKLEKFCDSNFDDFDNPERMKAIYQFAENWCNSPTDNIFLMLGSTGTGKTHLAKCIASQFILKHLQVRLVMVQELARDFNDLQYGKTAYDSFLDKYISPDLLIIDDLGCEPLTDVFISQFKQLLDVRKNIKKPIVITSNLTTEDILNRYTERIFSRLLDKKNSILIHFQNQDIRIKRR